MRSNGQAVPQVGTRLDAGHRAGAFIGFVSVPAEQDAIAGRRKRDAPDRGLVVPGLIALARATITSLGAGIAVIARGTQRECLACEPGRTAAWTRLGAFLSLWR